MAGAVREFRKRACRSGQRNRVHVPRRRAVSGRRQLRSRQNRAELQPAFINDDHVSEALAESSPTWSEPAHSRAAP
jgi:hypothetical protein